MTTRGSLQRGAIQQQFQGPVHRWKRYWVAVGTASNPACEPRLKRLKWVQLEDRAPALAGCRFPLTPVEKAGQSGDECRQDTRKASFELLPVKSRSPDEEENSGKEVFHVGEAQKEPEDNLVRDTPGYQPSLPQSSDDLGLSVPGIDASETSCLDQDPDSNIQANGGDEDVGEQDSEDQSIASGCPEAEPGESDMIAEHRLDGSGDISPLSFGEIPEQQDSFLLDNLQSADDELLMEEQTMPEEDAEGAGMTGSDSSEESDQAEPVEDRMITSEDDEEGPSDRDQLDGNMNDNFLLSKEEGTPETSNFPEFNSGGHELVQDNSSQDSPPTQVPSLESEVPADSYDVGAAGDDEPATHATSVMEVQPEMENTLPSGSADSGLDEGASGGDGPGDAPTQSN